MVGSPKLWNQAISRVFGGLSGQDGQDLSGHESSSLRSFLLSDATRQLCGLLYSVKCELVAASQHSRDNVYLKLLYPVANKIYLAYRAWCTHYTRSPSSKQDQGITLGVMNTATANGHVESKHLNTMLNDPFFQLILSALVHFKMLQFQLQLLLQCLSLLLLLLRMLPLGEHC